MNFSVRFATASDANQIAKLSRDQMEIWGLNPEYFDNKILYKQIEKKFVLVAGDTYSVFGFSAWIDKEFSDRLEFERVHITNTVVKPEYRRMGIAESLRRALINNCIQLGFKRITTNHHRDGVAIQGLSKKLGFKIYQEKNLDEFCKDDVFYELVL